MECVDYKGTEPSQAQNQGGKDQSRTKFDGINAKLQETKTRIQRNHDKVSVLQQQLRDLTTKLAVDDANLPNFTAEKVEGQEELSAACSEFESSQTAVGVLSKHRDIVHTIVEEIDVTIRPLGSQRGATPVDLREAAGLEGVDEPVPMTLLDLEDHFRFFKVMGVSNVHSRRADGIESMRCQLTMLLFPELLPSSKVESTDSRNRKIAMGIIKQKEEMETRTEELKQDALKADKAKAEAEVMLSRLAAAASIPCGTPRAGKRKSADIAGDADHHMQTPAHKAYRILQDMDPEVRAVLANAYNPSPRVQASPAVIDVAVGAGMADDDHDESEEEIKADSGNA
jgi:hypothetical protein